MELNDYQRRAMETCLPTSDNVLYMLLEIAEECGELAGKFAKAVRKGKIRFDRNVLVSLMSFDEFEVWKNEVGKEIGDILWGLAGISKECGFPLDSIGQMNVDKLASRKERGVIDGAGDNR